MIEKTAFAIMYDFYQDEKELKRKVEEIKSIGEGFVVTKSGTKVVDSKIRTYYTKRKSIINNDYEFIFVEEN